MARLPWRALVEELAAAIPDHSLREGFLGSAMAQRPTPLTLADLPDGGAGWRVYPALFARAGATPAARAALVAAGMLVDLARLYGDLAE